MDDERQPGPPAVASPYLTTPEAAEYCRCTVQAIMVSRWRTGHPVSVGRATRPLLFTRESLDAWMNGAGKPRRGRPRKGGAS